MPRRKLLNPVYSRVPKSKAKPCELSLYINPINLEETDKFVERMIDSLGFGDYDIRHLQSVKIEYFYCDSDETVKTITGRRTKGLYDMIKLQAI